jgi:Kef-type K+ transport system membrane component KefB
VRFSLSTLALAALVLVIPQALKLFASHIAPYAPRTEFAFLLMLAVVCAFATRKLGVYYLVGAFLVGLSARLFRDQLPALSSDRLLQTVEEFAIVFSPFYFYYAGGELRLADFDWRSIGLGVLLAVVLMPLRALQIASLQSRGSGFTWGERRRVGIALLPTLVFSIVLLGILRERFDLPSPLVGGVIVYTLVNTLFPGFLLRGRRAAGEDQAAVSTPS